MGRLLEHPSGGDQRPFDGGIPVLITFLIGPTSTSGLAMCINLRYIFVGVSGVLFGVLLLSVDTHAQDRSSEDAKGRFAEATVVTVQGDSLRGTVKWKRGYSTPEVIRFRTSPSDAVQTFSPSDVRSVDFADGRQLVSRGADVSQVPTDPTEAQRYLLRNGEMTRPDTLLLEVLVKGTLRLYARQGRRPRYVLEDDGEVFELLKVRKRPPTGNNIVTNHVYRRQLREATLDCPEVAEGTENLELALREVKAFVAEYNRCVGDADVFVREEPSITATSFGLTGGIMRSQYAMNEPTTPFRTFAWGNGLALGIGVTTRFLQTDGKLAIHAELAGSVQRISPGAEKEFFGERLSDAHFVEMEWAELKILPRYFFGQAKWDPYVEAGFTLGYLLSIREDTPPFYFLYPYTQKNISGFVEETGRYTLGLATGIGLQYDSIRVGLRAEGKPGWKQYTPIRSRVVSIVLTTEYYF